MRNILIAMLLALSSQAIAGQEGGGGGGICINGKCLTLAEAGIRISPNVIESNRWYITAEVEQEIDRIISLLPPVQTSLKAYAIGKHDTFVKVDSISKKLRVQIQKDYEAVLERAGNANMKKNLEIFAVSTRETTYLLPSFFSLTSYQKALILFHEAVIRHIGQLSSALRVDGFILDYIAGQNRSEIPLLKFLNDLELVDYGSFQSYLMGVVEVKIGRKLRLADFFMNGIKTRPDGYDKPNYTMIYDGKKLADETEKLLKGQRMLSEWTQIFANAKVEYSRLGAHPDLDVVKAAAVPACRGVNINGPADEYFALALTNPLVFVNCKRFIEENKTGYVVFNLADLLKY